ncbi:NAD-dependent epimerase/dehydratase family protein [Roseomonas sp. OT10]|uniref:NAD-dependent epimerase/dehydratase family protein n=1 Tax=Roseomonas cutis TaxID=2897332 RepID=UPI001E5F572A|nr:NAD-dependent epimerase/dehydratase family protein [Roseomonas sp. OT10]UFN49611.1 NAD-dependent epimerase/dehydratase family protein [Roseomonas sp. OT10]
MDWRGKRVLVTGGAGFLGSNLCHALTGRGADVIAVDAMLPEMGANPHNLEGSGARLVVADLRTADVTPLCEGVDVLFNFAAQTSHAGSMLDPLGDLSINAQIQLRLIGAMRNGAPNAVVVHASTRQFYGRPQYLPVDEAHPIVPPDFNGVSKWAGEQYWLLENRIQGRRVTALRLTNCYGPRLRIKDHRQTFLGIWIRRVLEGAPFEVWGGEQLRDLAHSDDVVEAFITAAVNMMRDGGAEVTAPGPLGPPRRALPGDLLEREAPAAARPVVGCEGRAFNIGGCPPISLRDLADALVDAAGQGSYETRSFPADRAAIDIGSFHADDSAFRTATGWAPRVTLAEGLRRTVDWFRPRLADYL